MSRALTIKNHDNKQKTYLVWEGVENVLSQPQMTISEFDKHIEEGAVKSLVPENVGWVGITLIRTHSDGGISQSLLEKFYK